jgi:GNAT superfamily N-acetyltransferase
MSDQVTTTPHLVVRPGGLPDAPLVEAMHERCSDLSLYRRFHAPLPRVSARMTRQLIAPTGGWSLLAQVDGDVVALACAAPTSAEELDVGLLVEDRHQRRGLGARLLHGVALEAAARGYQDIRLLAQADNDAVLATVRRAGMIGRVVWEDGLLAVTVPVHRLAARDMPRTA